jgi:hypothetical protein
LLISFVFKVAFAEVGFVTASIASGAGSIVDQGLSQDFALVARCWKQRVLRSGRHDRHHLEECTFKHCRRLEFVFAVSPVAAEEFTPAFERYVCLDFSNHLNPYQFTFD